MDYGEQLRTALPRWMEDGKGIRGDASPLVSQLRQQSFQTASFQTTFGDASVSRPLPSPPLGNEPEPFTPQPIIYPWIGQDTDDEGNYLVWFGIGDADFTPNDGTTAASLKAFQARIFDPNDGNASQFFLTVGSDDSDSDALVAQYGGNTLKAGWTNTDEGPEIWLQSADTTQASFRAASLVFQDSGNTHASGLHATHLDFDNAKVFLGYDEAQGEYKLTVSSGSNATGIHSWGLDVDQSKIFLGYGGDGYVLAIDGGSHAVGIHPEYLDFDNSKLFLGYTSDGYKLAFTGNSSGSAMTADDCTFKNGNDSTDLSAGELELTTSKGTTDLNGNTVSISAEYGGFYISSVALTQDGLATGSNGGVYIGGMSLLEGSLTMDGNYMETQQVTFIGQDGALWDGVFLGTEPQSQGDTNALWNLISDMVDDSIRTALDTLSATLTCNSDGSSGGTITFSYSY